MVDTNALLSVAFSVMAAFTDAVNVPHGPAPARKEVLLEYRLGTPEWIPAGEMYLADRQWRRFWIRDGAVWRFSCLESYRDNRGATSGPDLSEGPSIKQSAAIAAAAKAISSLATGGNPVASITPRLRIPGKPEENIPFYWITWPTTNSRGHPDFVAFVEVDARSGLTTFVELRDERFSNKALAERAKKADEHPPRVGPSRWALRLQAPLQRVVPYPTTNQVLEAIAGWLQLCSRLGLEPGTQTNIDAVFWPRTAIYTEEAISKTDPICQVQFTNGTFFEAVGGVALGHYAADSCFTGYWQEMTPEERAPFKGRVLVSWRDLAKGLEGRLINNLGIPRKMLSPFTAGPELKDTPVGAEGIKRVVVGWRNWPKKSNRFVSIDETRLAFAAEFDTETGDLKWINFRDPDFIAALRRTARTKIRK
jgi:hypothetical protein